MEEFVTLDSVSASDIFPNFGHLVFHRCCTKKNALIFLEIITVMINWLQEFMLSKSVCNHTRD